MSACQQTARSPWRLRTAREEFESGLPNLSLRMSVTMAVAPTAATGAATMKVAASAADAAGNTERVMGLLTAAAGFPVALLTTVKV